MQKVAEPLLFCRWQNMRHSLRIWRILLLLPSAGTRSRSRWRKSKPSLNLMASYQIEFRRSALKELRKLDAKIIPRIMRAVKQLGTDPRPDSCRKLVGSEHTYRIRIGDYRVVYSVDDIILVVDILRVRHRREAYD